MKKGLIISLIIGIILLAAGGGVIAYAVVNREDVPLVQNTYELEDAFTNISVDIGAEALEFVPTTDGTKKVVCDETEKIFNEVKVEEGTLKITQTDSNEWYENWFNFNLSENLKVTIYMPAGEYEVLSIKASTGATTIPADFTFNKADIKLSTGVLDLKAKVNTDVNIEASTGSVKVEGITPKSLYVYMSTGSLSIKDVEVEGACTLRVSTGKVNVNNLKANTLTVNASTGKITLENTIIVDSINIKASTGDVKLIDSDAQTLTIETSTGDVEGTLLTAKIFDVRTDTGDVDVPMSGVGGICKVTTDTGSITIRIKA